MRRMSKNFLLPNFEASSIALIALVVLMNSQPVRAEVSFGPGPSTQSKPPATTPAKAATPASKPAAKDTAATTGSGSDKPAAPKKAASEPKS